VLSGAVPLSWRFHLAQEMKYPPNDFHKAEACSIFGTMLVLYHKGFPSPQEKKTGRLSQFFLRFSSSNQGGTPTK
jgi:hypothetical protein